MDAMMAAQASAAEWGGIAAAAGGGALKLEPGAAEQCAQRCVDAWSALDAQINAISDLNRLDGFGDWGSGKKLAAKFEGKADGTANSGVEVLRKHQDILKSMAQAFRDAAAAYHATESQNASSLH